MPWARPLSHPSSSSSSSSWYWGQCLWRACQCARVKINHYSKIFMALFSVLSSSRHYDLGLFWSHHCLSTCVVCILCVCTHIQTHTFSQKHVKIWKNAQLCKLVHVHNRIHTHTHMRTYTKPLSHTHKPHQKHTHTHTQLIFRIIIISFVLALK